MTWIAVLVGGALGSLARYGVNVALAERLGHGTAWGTLAVNVVGSFLAGAVLVLADERGSIGPQARAFLIAGVLGGVTTFSTFSIETVRFLDEGRPELAGLNIAANVTLSLLSAAAGLILARSLAA